MNLHGGYYSLVQFCPNPARAEVANILPPGESAKSIGDNDLWIASTASVLKATLLTTDKDFRIFDKIFLDVVYIDPEKFKERP